MLRFYLSRASEIRAWTLPTCIFDKIGYFIDSIIYKIAYNRLNEKSIFIIRVLFNLFRIAHTKLPLLQNLCNLTCAIIVKFLPVKILKCLEIYDESELNLTAPKTLNVRVSRINSWRLFCIWKVSVSISIIRSGILTAFCSILFNAHVLLVS